MDLAWEDPAAHPTARYKRPTAFLCPESGGREWHADPDTVQRA
ncbi:hypothetical protein ACIQV3_11320 [Streptomyces sp. NPDC099050]